MINIYILLHFILNILILQISCNNQTTNQIKLEVIIPNTYLETNKFNICYKFIHQSIKNYLQINNKNNNLTLQINFINNTKTFIQQNNIKYIDKSNIQINQIINLIFILIICLLIIYFLFCLSNCMDEIINTKINTIINYLVWILLILFCILLLFLLIQQHFLLNELIQQFVLIIK